MKKICPTCKQFFTKTPSDSKKYWERRKYCSLPCSNTWYKIGQKSPKAGDFMRGKIGSLSPRWKGGKNITTDGYVRVLIPGKGSYILEHRKIMEDLLGRKLFRCEHVHHINENKTDNRIENLKLMSIKEHNHMHTLERWNNKNKPFRFNLKNGF